MPLTVLFVLDQGRSLPWTLTASWSGWSKSLCSLHVLRGADTSSSLSEGCPSHSCDLLCHLCSHRCGNPLFMSEEPAVTRTLISLHGHVSLSLGRNIAMLNTHLHTETCDSTWFQNKPFNGDRGRGEDDKPVMIHTYPSGHVTELTAKLRSLPVT